MNRNGTPEPPSVPASASLLAVGNDQPNSETNAAGLLETWKRLEGVTTSLEYDLRRNELLSIRFDA
jgi:hypothetical protein